MSNATSPDVAAAGRLLEERTRAAALHVLGPHRKREADAIGRLVAENFHEIDRAIQALLAPMQIADMDASQVYAQFEERARSLAAVAVDKSAVLLLDVLIVIGTRGKSGRTQ